MWNPSWIQLVPRLSPRDRQTGQLTRTLRVISAGQKWCPWQDSNLRSRLWRPVQLVIADAFRRPTWALCPRLVSLVASRVLWFVPRDIPRQASSLDEFETLVLREVGVVLDVERDELHRASLAAVG